MRIQDKLIHEATSGPVHLPPATEADMAAGAWTDPGTYSSALDTFISEDSTVRPSQPSQPIQLSADVALVVSAGSALQSDVKNGGLLTGQPVQQDYAAFRANLAALAIDCGMKVPASWLSS